MVMQSSDEDADMGMDWEHILLILAGFKVHRTQCIACLKHQSQEVSLMYDNYVNV